MNPDKCNQVAVYFSWEDNWLKNIRITFNAKNWATDTLYIYSRKQLPTNTSRKIGETHTGCTRLKKYLNFQAIYHERGSFVYREELPLHRKEDFD